MAAVLPVQADIRMNPLAGCKSLTLMVPVKALKILAPLKVKVLFVAAIKFSVPAPVQLPANVAELSPLESVVVPVTLTAFEMIKPSI